MDTARVIFLAVIVTVVKLSLAPAVGRDEWRTTRRKKIPVPISIYLRRFRQTAKEIYSLINTVMMIKLFARIFTKFFSPLHCQNMRAWFSLWSNLLAVLIMFLRVTCSTNRTVMWVILRFATTNTLWRKARNRKKRCKKNKSKRKRRNRKLWQKRTELVTNKKSKGWPHESYSTKKSKGWPHESYSTGITILL